MRSSPLASLAFLSLFLLGCAGCCSGFTEGFEQGFNEDFGPSFKKSFVESCAGEVQGGPPGQAEAQCGCMADRMLATHTPTELMTLSVSAGSPEFQVMIEDAAAACVGVTAPVR